MKNFNKLMAATVGNFSASSDVPQKYMLYICDKL